MYLYKLTYLGGSSEIVRANSPKHAFDLHNNKDGLEVIFVKFFR